MSMEVKGPREEKETQTQMFIGFVAVREQMSIFKTVKRAYFCRWGQLIPIHLRISIHFSFDIFRFIRQIICVSDTLLFLFKLAK